MFHNRPLTWLFIIASACLDLAMLATNDSSPGPGLGSFSFFMFNFVVPGQLSVLAVWSVLGGGHRLMRAAVATVATCLLLFAVRGDLSDDARNLVVADYLLHVLSVVAAATIFQRLHLVTALTPDVEEAPDRFRFPLIEYFGWSIVVAIWAFMWRYTDLRQLQYEKYWWSWFGCSIAPVVVLPLVFGKIQVGARILRLMVLYLLVLLGYALVRFTANLQGPFPAWATVMVSTQITYIAAWWAVMQLDAVMVERRRVTAASRQTLAHFEPEHSE